MGCGASTDAPKAAPGPDGKPLKPAPSQKELSKASYRNMADVFKVFDTDGDGVLDIGEFKRAFRAIGLKKRDGTKYDVDQEMFNSFDKNGDGRIQLLEFEMHMKPATRAKINELLDAGWQFDPELWSKSQERHAKWDMAKVFKQFDTDNDGGIDIHEFQRAFRALGLKKRDGEKYEVDQAMFNSFDTNGDGKISLQEFETNLKPRTREKIEMLLDAGWKFDADAWRRSQERHAHTDMAKVYKQFDTDGDGSLNFREFQRAFRALGLKKRDGTKYDVDLEMFKSFDTNGDGMISLDEFEKGLKPRTREKIETLLAAGWKFDEKLWLASQERHKDDPPFDSNIAYNQSKGLPGMEGRDMAEVFKVFDTDGDGVLDIGEFKRAFRALGLKNREGAKYEVDQEMFNSFDKNGDGKIQLLEFETNMKPRTREKINELLDAGWKFDPELWSKSVERHSKWNMAKVFKQFDTDGDGVLDIDEFKRAFRALGLKNREGAKYEVDQEMFNSFDTNGDGKIQLEEFEANMKPRTREKIETLLDAGWKFDAELWKESQERHAHWDMSKVYKQFDTDGDGCLDFREFQRAFRALGLKKRDGTNYDVDLEMFKSFDTNGDGMISLDEFEKGLKPRTREKIEMLLDAGWKFDEKLWMESQDRHKNDPPFDPKKAY